MLDTLRAGVDSSIFRRDIEAFALHDVQPGAVLEPRSADEAATVMRLASENGWRVECAGNGTQMYGNRRTRADIVISTRVLNHIVEYEPADLVIGVQAGMTLHALQREVQRNRQFLAQDPPAHAESTIGSLIATSRSGPLRYAHGTMRDHVLGLQVVTADGRVLNVGGRVVKNVAGYDLVRLLVGSGGTLGLISAAYLRLKPLPHTDHTIIIAAADPAPLLEITRFIVEMHLEAQAIELLGPSAEAAPWQLQVRLAGNHESVVDARARVTAKASELSSQLKDGSVNDWEALQEIELAAHTTIRLADLPTRIELMLQAAQKITGKIAARSRIVAHAADGIVRVLLGESSAEETAFAIGEARALVVGGKGTVIVHSGNAELMRRVDAFGATGAQLKLMANIKSIFDPAGILAPGRFVV
jgi:glycolate oxidase FAD binding subunit